MKANLSETDKAYIAGFFDGEGHISITKAKVNPSRWKNPRCHLLVAMTNTNKRIIEFIHSSFNLIAQKIDPYRSFIPHGKQLFQLRFEGRPCKTFLEAIARKSILTIKCCVHATNTLIILYLLR